MGTDNYVGQIATCSNSHKQKKIFVQSYITDKYGKRDHTYLECQDCTRLKL